MIKFLLIALVVSLVAKMFIDLILKDD